MRSIELNPTEYRDFFLSPKAYQLAYDEARKFPKNGPPDVFLLNLYRHMMECADKMAGLVRTEMSTPQTVCREGCDFCCRKPDFRITLPELLAIEDYTRTRHPSSSLGGMLKQAGRIASQLVDGVFQEGTAYHWHCPFLSEQRRCGVYPVRPISCRGYASFELTDCIECCREGREPIHIQHDPARNVYRLHFEVAVDWNQFRLYETFRLALEKVLQERGFREGSWPFPEAMEAMLRRLVDERPSRGSQVESHSRVASG